MNCLHSFRTENKLKSHEKVCENKYFCGIVVPSEKDNILEFNENMKSDKMSYIIYAEIESLVKKIDVCTNNPENLSTKKQVSIFFVDIQFPQFGYFCNSLREHAANILNFEKKKMLLLTKEELTLHQDAKNCYICGKEFSKKFAKDKNYRKVRDNYHLQVNTEVQHIVYVIYYLTLHYFDTALLF